MVVRYDLINEDVVRDRCGAFVRIEDYWALEGKYVELARVRDSIIKELLDIKDKQENPR
jgi:hypothetical protein